MRSSSRLFISSQAPHNAVSKNTLSRWIKIALCKDGVNIIFKPHSTRAASTSAAARQVDISHVLRTAEETSEGTFARFYKNLFCQKKDTVFLTVFSVRKLSIFEVPWEVP